MELLSSPLFQHLRDTNRAGRYFWSCVKNSLGKQYEKNHEKKTKLYIVLRSVFKRVSSITFASIFRLRLSFSLYVCSLSPQHNFTSIYKKIDFLNTEKLEILFDFLKFLRSKKPRNFSISKIFIFVQISMKMFNGNF